MIARIVEVTLIDSIDYKGVWYNRYEVQTSWLTNYNNTYILYLKFGHEPPNIGKYYSYENNGEVMTNVKLEQDFDETNITGSISTDNLREITRRINGGGSLIA